MNEQLKSRFKSFAWRLGMMVAAVSVDFILQNLTILNIPTQYTVVLGLVLGEVSKHLNNKLTAS